MCSYILNLMWRRRERLALVLLGIMLVSLASGLAASTARTTQGVLDDELAQHWRSDYDLLIRHPDAVSQLEKDAGFIPSQYQSNAGATGAGISDEQLDIIRRITGVEVAAPLSLVGYANITPNDWNGVLEQWIHEAELEPGIYHRQVRHYDSDGLDDFAYTHSSYIVVGGPWESEPPPGFDLEEFLPGLKDGWPEGWSPWEVAVLSQAGLSTSKWAWTAGKYCLVAAVDPEAEAKLSGLDQALIKGEYFPQPSFRMGQWESAEVFALVNSEITLPHRIELELSKVDIEPGYDAIFRALDHPRPGFFSTLPAKSVYSRSQEFGSEYLTGTDAGYFVEQTGGPMQYLKQGDSVAVRAWAVDNRGNLGNAETAVRLFREAGLPGSNISFTASGHFVSNKLSVMPADSPVIAPMEIYSYQSPRILQAKSGSAPSTFMQPTHALGFAGVPVGILVDQQAGMLTRRYRQDGQQNLVNPPWLWDSVRVRVSGVEDMSEQSQVRIMAIAQQVRDATGLHVDVVLGSSRSRVPVTLLDYDSDERQRYREEVQETMDSIARRLEAEAGERLVWSYTPYSRAGATLTGLMRTSGTSPDSGPDLSMLSYVTPLLWPRVREAEESVHDRQLRAQIDRYLNEIKAIPGITYTEDRARQSSTDGFVYLSIPDYQIPESEARTVFGVVEELWVEMGTALRIYHETNRGTFWITICLLVVSGLFIGNTTYISAIGRTGEFSLLRALGWRRNTVFKVSVLETITIAAMAGIVTALIIALVWLFSPRYLESWLLLVIAPVVFLTFILGSLPPLVGMLFVPMLEGARRGELKATTALGGPRPVGFVLRGLAARPGRTVVTTIALAVPAGALAFMFHVFFGIQSLLGETMLGEYMALEFRGYHFVLNALIFAVAGLAVTDTLLVNLRERQQELGLLKALGWRDGTVAGLLFWEGVGLGLVGGIVGSSLAVLAYSHVFLVMPQYPFWGSVLMALITAAVGGLASIVPMTRARGIRISQN